MLSSFFLPRELNKPQPDKSEANSFAPANANTRVCDVSGSPIYALKKRLEFRLQESGYYLLNVLEDALHQSAIYNSISTAIFNPFYFEAQADPRRTVTDEVNIKLFTTSEGDKAAILTWCTEQSKDRAYQFLVNEPYKPKNIFFNDYLFISKNESIFIPAPQTDDIEELRHFAGMQLLYADIEYRKKFNADFVQRLGNEDYVVRLLGEAVQPLLRDPKREVSVNTDNGKVIVSEKNTNCAIDTLHIFKRQQDWFGLFPSKVVYDQQKSIGQEVLEVVFGHDYCAKK